MYDPTLGRFLSRDPLGYTGGEANLYEAFGDSPAAKRDPRGESAALTLALQTLLLIGPPHPTQVPRDDTFDHDTVSVFESNIGGSGSSSNVPQAPKLPAPSFAYIEKCFWEKHPSKPGIKDFVTRWILIPRALHERDLELHRQATAILNEMKSII